jgi:signal transduction histidine kinase
MLTIISSKLVWSAPEVSVISDPKKPSPPASICYSKAPSGPVVQPQFASMDWKCANKKSVELGFSNDYYWFWLRIKDNSSNIGVRFMMGLFDEADLIVDRAGIQTRYLNHGESLPFSHRLISAPELVLPLGAPTGEEADVYVRVRTTSSVFFTPEIGDLNTLVRRANSDAMISVLSCGFLLAVSLYGLVLAFSQSNINAIWLTTLSLGGILWEMSVSGIGFMYLWGDYPWFQTSSTFRGAALWMGGYVLFSLGVLTFYKIGHLLNWLIHCFATFLFCLAITAPFLDPVWVGYVLSLSALAMPIPLLILGVMGYLRGDKSLKWMIAGIAVNDIATVLVALSSIGIFQNSGTRLLPVVTMPTMIAMFGLTMASRRAAARRNRMRELQDIVEERTASLLQANSKLKVAWQQLETLRSEESRLFRLATHDLRGPLNIMSMRLMRLSFEKKNLGHNEIQSELAPLEASVEYLANILDETQASLGTLGEAGRPPGSANTNLQAECQALVDAYLPMAATKQVRLILLAQAPVSINIDKLRLVRILRNWVENAISHCPAGTEVQVELLARSMSQNDNGAVEIAVTDNGPGLPIEVEQNTFGPGARVPDNALHGIGLFSTVIGASRIGATIRYTRPVTGGSRFSLILPTQQSVAPADEEVEHK